MQRKPVESSAFSSVGYDIRTATLELEFREGGAVWQYFDVPADVYMEFMGSDSLGRFFVVRIKGKFREGRI